jgi:alpha-aminoadipate carrier protein LysW
MPPTVAANSLMRKGTISMPSAYCPDCDEKITLNAKPAVGQKLTCPHCDADLEVISVEPLELDWAYDWEWEDEEEDDEEDY